MAKFAALLCITALAFCSVSFASDPKPLQDFCVANAASTVKVNGAVCKDPTTVTADDFFFSGFNKTGNTSNGLGFAATQVTATQLPGLNTLGVSLVRLDYAPNGVNPPHIHPRATEILTVIQGTLHVGFVTSAPGNQLFTKVLYPGDVFVFPVALVHFQLNVGYGNAVAITGLSSQNPGVIQVAPTVFGSTPSINDDVLAKAFQIQPTIVQELQAKF